MQRQGTISVQTENIFPIIKQFLYSDQEIFLRELIANATDATSKIVTLAAKGIHKDAVGDTQIEVKIDKDKGTLTISDNGVGMTEDEVIKYLNQVAFSSAQEFLEKYKDETIIGHFGLGFYSAFMVADKVEVITQSFEGDANAVKWTCLGDPSYTIEDTTRESRGTDIVLHISDDATEYLEKDRIESLLKKYCAFLPYEIKFGTRTETTFEGEGDEQKEIKTEVDNIINNPNPLWKKSAADISDEDYKAFYRELHPFAPEPLFWIHLNIDYPFNLTGILYFPKLGNTMELQRNKISLYANQVYVTDDVKEIVPEFLTLLHGVIDSPDIPLNVSRSYLQSDRNVKKITSYITRKVGEKLGELFKNDRQAFEDKWEETSIFVKYGMISEEKFYDKVKDIALLKSTDGTYSTLEEYKTKVAPAQTNKYENVVYLYANSIDHHDSFIKAATQKGYDVLLLDQIIDNHFIQHLEQKLEKTTFKRVDADIADELIETDEVRESILSDSDIEKVKSMFLSQLKLDEHRMQLKPMNPEDLPVTVVKPEFMRRMQDMQQTMGLQMGELPETFNVIVNTNHPLVAQKLLRMRNADKKRAIRDVLIRLSKTKPKHAQR